MFCVNVYFRYILWNNEHGWTIGDSSSLTNSEQYFLSGHEGWKYFADKGMSYKYFSTPVKRWTDARSFCQLISPGAGDLASVSDRTTNDFLTTVTTRRAWIGGYEYEDQNGRWVWSDGTIWNFTKWAQNQPDNTWGAENCVVFNFGNNGQGNWNDANGVDSKEFICQYQGKGIMFTMHNK